MPLVDKLAKNIRTRRGDKSQQVFARKLGISQSTLARLESAEQNTTLRTLQQLMKALRCTNIAELFS